MWSVNQDHVNGNLIFAGTEFGLFFTPDGGQRWVQLRGGLPTAQVRDMDVQRRENDLVLGTFGRSFYVLDDYSALRGVTAESLRQEAALFPLRHAYQFPTLGQYRGDGRQLAVAESAVRRGVHVSRARSRCRRARRSRSGFRDPSGRQVRNMPLSNDAGPAARGVESDRGAAGAGAAADAAAAEEDAEGAEDAEAVAAVAAPVAPGRYFAQLVKVSGETVTPLGTPQSFEVRPLLK